MYQCIQAVVRGDSEGLEADFTGGFGMPGMIVHEEDAFGGRLAESDRCLKDLGSGFYESGFPKLWSRCYPDFFCCVHVLWRRASVAAQLRPFTNSMIPTMKGMKACDTS